MKAFRCKGCGTGFTTAGDDIPPSPNWDDGHVCEMVEVESKLEKRLRAIGQNGNTGEHYD